MSEEGKKDTPEQSEFRKYCRDWLSKNVPPQPSFRLPQSAMEIMTQEQMDYLSAWQKSAYEAGLVGCDYPKEYGGGGRANCQRIANEEMQQARTPYFPNVIALGMAAPTLYHHASEELKSGLFLKFCPAKKSGARGSASPMPVRIWPMCRPLLNKQATHGSSTVRRSGPPLPCSLPG